MTSIPSSGFGTVDSGLLNPQSTIRNPQSAIEAPQSSGSEIKDAFSDFVGQTFFGQLIASMRKTVDKPAYFHGGRAEEVFQGQLDQMLAERISDVSREQFAEPMFELFMMQRPG